MHSGFLSEKFLFWSKDLITEPAFSSLLFCFSYPEFRLLKIGSGKDYKHLSTGDIPVYGSGGYMLSVNDYLYDGESVCIGRKGTINNPIFLTGKFWTVDTLFYTHSFRECLAKFIYSIFQNINWLSYNEAGGIPSLSKTIIGKIEVLVPKPNEQQKNRRLSLRSRRTNARA
ncbi:restriction endonuclease subunit S [Xenorhabdus nematophila]|uniref:restriction endonuclease subunit S n=1 Tax=Xenorhabdus nematophila TaxID=628 RepID=UPI00068C242F|nr:restriction endonuclease subunit S [Xenorhabdus nematophila]